MSEKKEVVKVKKKERCFLTEARDLNTILDTLANYEKEERDRLILSVIKFYDVYIPSSYT